MINKNESRRDDSVVPDIASTTETSLRDAEDIGTSWSVHYATLHARLIVARPPGLSIKSFYFNPTYSPESIKEPHESYPYNLKIAEALYKSTYLESWGSGAKRIMDACHEQGVEDPTWRSDGGFIIVTFKHPTRNIAQQETKELPKENDKQIKNHDKEVQQRNLSELQRNILQLIRERPSITLNELAIKLAISISALRNQRSQMEKKGIWEIKFE